MRLTLFNLFALYLLLSTSLVAQESVSANGGTITSGSGASIAYTIGVPLYVTLDGEGTEEQGVMHGYWLIDPIIPLSFVQTRVYPNPFQEQLIIEIDTGGHNNLTFEIFDVIGRQVVERKIVNNYNEINLVKLPSALYYLIIKQNNTPIGSYKLFKQ